MGYLVTGPDTHLFVPALKNDFREIDKFLESYDMFQDDPWYMIYPYLSQKYPNAKFVFLERDEASWLKSVQNFYGHDRYNNAIRRMFYGNADTILCADKYLEKYRDHNREVKAYFKSSENFISISISNNEDAIRLQKFLGEPVRFKKFPHKNKANLNKTERKKKKFANLFYGWFGLKQVLKKQLKRYMGYTNFVNFRTKVRFVRAKIRLFVLKVIYLK